MAKSLISGVRLAGVSTCVPDKIFDNQYDAPHIETDEIRKVVAMAGIKERRVSGDNICSSDLCLQAAKSLLKRLDWRPDSIDALIFVTQTPDYFLPSTSCILHRELALSEHCASMDIGLGCSGYPYGMWLASMMIQSGSAKRVLLLNGETPSRFTDQNDRGTFLLFGDAGSASGLEASPQTGDWAYCLHTDGAGAEDLIIPAGGFRQRFADQDRDNYLYMNGGNLFNFTVKKIPELIQNTFDLAGKSDDDVDAFIFHQSNQFIMKHIAKKRGLAASKVPIILDKYGNSGGPSVPLTITLGLSEDFFQQPRQLMLLGYGVGLSWGSALISTEPDLILQHEEIAVL